MPSIKTPRSSHAARIDAAQITGHTYDHTLKILETYLPRKRELAAKAAAEMERYYADLNGNALR